MASETTADAVPIWQEPPPPVHTSMEWLKLPGLERLRVALLDGNFPPAPYSRLTGARPVEYGDGTAVFEMPVSPWLQSSAGVLSGGVMAFLADSPLGGAVMTKNPPGTVITTSELAMNYLRPATLASRMLRARSTVIHLGRSFALSEVYIEDIQGRLLAHGTARNLMISLPVPEGPFEMPRYDDPEPEQPDPYLRPVQGAVLPADVWREISGLEIQRKQVSGELPPSPCTSSSGFAALPRTRARSQSPAPPPAGCRRRSGGFTAAQSPCWQTPRSPRRRRPPWQRGPRSPPSTCASSTCAR